MRFLIFFLLFFSYLAAEEQYIISYRGVVKENRLYNERFNVAKAMVPKSYTNYRELLTLDYRKGESVPTLIRRNQDRVTEELFKQGVLMNDALTKGKYAIDTKTVITLPPTYITVTIKEDSATIRLIK